MFCNLITQTEMESCPTEIGASFALKWPCAILIQEGYREIVSTAQPQEGCRVAKWMYADMDGIHARKMIAEQVNIIEEQNAQAEARAQAEIARQAAKPLGLKQAENDYIALCQSLTGAASPLAPDQLEAIGKTLEPATAKSLADTVIYLNAKAQANGGGFTPWVDAVWHSEIVQ